MRIFKYSTLVILMAFIFVLPGEGATPKVSGGAYFFPENTIYRASFSMEVTGPPSSENWFKYYYTRTRMNFVSTGITSATISGNTAEIKGSGTVNGAGSYTFTAKVTDTKPDLFQITIKKPDGSVHYSAGPKGIAGGDLVVQIPTQPNQPPIAYAGQNQTISLQTGQTSVNIQLEGTGSNDPDGTIVSYAWTGSPDPADVVTPTVTLAAGSYTFTLVVTDNQGASSTPSSVTITVLPPPGNQPPTANAGPDKTVVLPPGQDTVNVQLSGSGSDPDGTITAFIWSGTPDPQDIQNPVVSLGEGTYNFTLIVKDNLEANSGPSTTIITVVRANPPILSVSPLSYSTNQGQEVRIEVSSIDPDGEPVTISATPIVTNATFTATPGTTARGTFIFTPDSTQTGLHFVSFKARDPLGLSDSKTIQISVNKVNQSPVLTVPQSASVDEGKILNLQVQASDPNGDMVILSASGLPTNAIFIGSTGTLTFAPDYTQAGTYQITFIASDGQLSTSKTVPITVHDVPTGGTGQPGELILQVDPVESPTFQTTQRITGTVNVTGTVPTVPKIKSALITGMSPTTGEQGQTLTVELNGQGSGDYATHFTANVSQANFGMGITVNSINVTSPTQVSVNISIGPNASEGPRSVSITTRSEVAVSVLAFSVTKGKSSITGKLIDPDSGKPISGATITIQGTSISTITGADGSFTLLNVQSGQQILIVNAPNHEFIVTPVTAQSGIAVDLGEIQSKTTVFDPTAPPSVSLLSILGRGIGGTIGGGRVEDLKKAVTDTILLVGGTEAGVLDEYLNQLNPAVSGEGMASLTPAGVDWIADRLNHGESISLQEILFAFSFAFQWTSGIPFTLQDWLVGLQDLVNQAWQDPNHPDNQIIISMFNKGKSLSLEPPILSPYSRLSALQAYLLVSSFLTYVVTRESGGPASPSVMLAAAAPSVRTLIDAAPLPFGLPLEMFAQAQPPSQPSVNRPYTRFWRNFFTAKGNYPATTLNQVLTNYYTALLIASSFIPSALLSGPGVINLALYGGTALGFVAVQLNAVLSTMGTLNRIPEPPSIIQASTITNADGRPVVEVVLKRSFSDKQEADTIFFYTLYRFPGSGEGRTVIAQKVFNKNEELILRDHNPPFGSSFYAATVTKLKSNGKFIESENFQEMIPLWSLPTHGQYNPFLLLHESKRGLTSDYSVPYAVLVSPVPIEANVDAIETDPRIGFADIVYYSDATKKVLYRIGDGGEGVRTLFAGTGFKSSVKDGREIGQMGLAIDGSANLYCDNAASDSQFGGRLFRFLQPNGEREFVGTVNYFSQLLMFAQPTAAGPMTMHPNKFNGDLFVVDELTQWIKRVPVNAPYDPYRRVGQPYAPIPSGGWGKIIDMTFDQDGTLYILELNRILRIPYNESADMAGKVEIYLELTQ